MPWDGSAGAVTGRVPPDLEARWRALWGRVGGHGEGLDQLALIAAHYAEPARRYHTLVHIAECLAELESERAAASRPDEAELALWFHDVVYDPRAGDNEARSAALAARVLLQETRLGPDAVGRVTGMILSTTHAAPPPPGDAALVCDADLAILGSEPERYASYTRQIADEYAWVPMPVFRLKRAAVLRRLLERESIYGTPGFRNRYEDAARRNIGAELVELERRGPS